VGKVIGRGAVEGAVSQIEKEVALKPGIKTTEFWITMISQVIAGILSAMIANGQVDPFSSVGKFIVAVVAALSGLTGANYVHQRTRLKKDAE